MFVGRLARHNFQRPKYFRRIITSEVDSTTQALRLVLDLRKDLDDTKGNGGGDKSVDTLSFSFERERKGSSHSADGGELSDDDDLDQCYSPNTRRKLYRKSRTKRSVATESGHREDGETTDLELPPVTTPSRKPRASRRKSIKANNETVRATTAAQG